MVVPVVVEPVVDELESVDGELLAELDVLPFTLSIFTGVEAFRLVRVTWLCVA